MAGVFTCLSPPSQPQFLAPLFPSKPLSAWCMVTSPSYKEPKQKPSVIGSYFLTLIKSPNGTIGSLGPHLKIEPYSHY